MPRASGVGSWPGLQITEAVRQVRDLLVVEQGLPYLPELPARGPGADLVGRSAGLLVELPVDLQPSGWRLTDAPGRDVRRARSLLGEDLDALAEAYDGFTGELKVQVAGPWTLAASIFLPRGERAVHDPGAGRDLAASLAEGVRDHLAALARLVPGARWVLQVDEPALPGVLGGVLPTASGLGVLPAIEPDVVRAGLTEVLAAAAERATTVVHCCAPDVPVELLRAAGADAVSIDTSLLDRPGWEELGAVVERGATAWAGIVPTDATAPRPDDLLRPLLGAWESLGLGDDRLDAAVLTPACGLAGATPRQALDLQRAAVAAADLLAERLA